MSLNWLVFSIRPLYLIGMWFSEDQRANIVKTHVQRSWTTSSNIKNYYTLNIEHNWEDLCILTTMTYSRELRSSHMFHHEFVNATQLNLIGRSWRT